MLPSNDLLMGDAVSLNGVCLHLMEPNLEKFAHILNTTEKYFKLTLLKELSRKC